MGGIRKWSRFDDVEKIEAVKNKLRSYRKLVSKHDACRDLFERLCPNTTQNFSADKIQCTSGNSSESKTHAMIDLKNQMANNLKAMQDEIDGIVDLIKALPPDEYTVIMRRYTLNERMEIVAEKTFSSTRHCWSLHESAVRRLAESVQ